MQGDNMTRTGALAQHVSDLRDWLHRDQRDRQNEFRGVLERLHYLHEALAKVNPQLPQAPNLRKSAISCT